MEMEDPSDIEVRSFFVRALYDFSSDDSSSLSFNRGALIEVLTQLESGWWDGLLGNDVRGWFPSNYVEPIPDEEAELELRSRGSLEGRGVDSDSIQFVGNGEGYNERGTGLEQALGFSTSTYQEGEEGTNDDVLTSTFSGLGLGSSDLDGLRQLISSTNEDSTSDAFEQLAEAAMLDQNRINSNGSKELEEESLSEEGFDEVNSRIGVTTASMAERARWRKSKMSEQTTSPGGFTSSENGGNSSIINPTRSASTSISTVDIDGPKGFTGIKESRNRAVSNTSASLQSVKSSNYPPSSNQNSNGNGRNRASTQVDQSSSYPMRERAASASLASRDQPGISNNPKGTQSPRKSGRSSGRKDLRKRQSESDFWEPKVTDRGEVS